MIEEFHYRIPWRTRSAYPGRHSSSQTGGEQEFFGHVPLIVRPEPHNLDIHASLLDPFQQYVVRTYRQRGTINVHLLADLSASMGFRNKMEILADFTEKTAYSAYRSGDNFAFFGCDETLNEQLYLPPRWYKGGAPDLVAKLKKYRPKGKNCLALYSILDVLPRQRSLIFLASDFHFPLHEITRIFDALIRHDVVPIVFWHAKEFENLPNWGLYRFFDAESGQNRHLLMRPSLREKIIRCFSERRKQLAHLFSRYGRQPFFIGEQFQPDQMTRYFYEL